LEQLANFFRSIIQIDAIKEESFLMGKNIEYFMMLDVCHGVELLDSLHEKEYEEKMWYQWLSVYPHMTQETFVSFGDYLDRLKPKQVETRPTSELVKELEELKRSFEK